MIFFFLLSFFLRAPPEGARGPKQISRDITPEGFIRHSVVFGVVRGGVGVEEVLVLVCVLVIRGEVMRGARATGVNLNLNLN